MNEPVRMAFYDLDGTLVSSNIVIRYAFYLKKLPSKARALLKFSKLLVNLPFLVGLNFHSRRLFNEMFYREYRGMKKEWLLDLAQPLFDEVVRPSVYPSAMALVEADRTQGFLPVLVTGELDFALGPVVRYFAFHDLISNSLVFNDGTATGKVVPPLIAEGEKVTAMKKLCHQYRADAAQCKAYADSFSDVPMLEAVGRPATVHPDRRLRRVAAQRGWPIIDLRTGDHVHVY